MLDITPKPDFQRFLDVLMLRKAYRRPPLFDFHVDHRHKADILGREVKTPADDVEFWRVAGYDYVQFTIHVAARELAESKGMAKGDASTHGSDNDVITSLEQFRSREWSWQAAAEGDLACCEERLEWLGELLKVAPPEMKIIVHNADIFTLAWEMIGFTSFCMKSYEEPELIREVMDSLAAAQLNVTREAVKIAGEATGCVFYSDDIAYTEGLMMSPDFFRDYLFDHIAAFGKIGQAVGAPLIYHTDGRLYEAFDDFARIGVRGVQPLEPKSMDPLEIKRRWPGKFCLMGNIDLDTMGRGTPDEVEAHVRDRVETVGAGGGFMPGVSNTVPYYVKIENYRRMIETVHSYPDGEIDVA